MMILLSGLAIGMMKSLKLAEREQALLQLQKMILRFKAEISFSARPISELIASCSEFKICNEAAKIPNFEQNPTTALLTAGEQVFENKQDKELYSGFITGLGTSRTESQLEHIELYSGLIAANLSDAKNEREQKSRLYVALGGFGAVTICMMML